MLLVLLVSIEAWCYCVISEYGGCVISVIREYGGCVIGFFRECGGCVVSEKRLSVMKSPKGGGDWWKFIR